MKLGIYIFIGIIVLGYVIGLFSTQTLRTETEITASPEAVWKHLIDFKEYPKWNPFIKKISGELSVGSQISVTINPPGKSPMDFQPEVLEVVENKEFRWKGKVLMPKLFDGEHYFILKENPDGTTNLVQGENFTGILAMLLWGSMEQRTRQGFEEMNKALKTRSEAIN